MTLSKAKQKEIADAKAAAELEAANNTDGENSQDQDQKEENHKEEAPEEKPEKKMKAAPPTLSVREQLAIKNQEVMEQMTVVINKLHEAETFAKGNGRPFLHIFSTKQRIGGMLQQYKVNSK